MISDTLSDAVDEIQGYLNRDPDYAYRDEIERLCFVMDRMRGLLDDPNPPAEKGAALRRFLPDWGEIELTKLGRKELDSLMAAWRERRGVGAGAHGAA